MKKEKEIFVYGVFKNFDTLEYKIFVFGGQVYDGSNIQNVWFQFTTKKKFAHNFPSVAQAKKFIRQSFRTDDPPEYACIIIDGKIRGDGWTHTKKHIETIPISRFKRGVWVNSGVVLDEIFKGVWGK